jgi:hypothetical protein
MDDKLTFQEDPKFLKRYFYARRRLFNRVKKVGDHWIYSYDRMKTIKQVAFVMDGKSMPIRVAAMIFWNHLKSLDSKKFVVISTCKEKNCVNPKHVYIVTLSEKSKIYYKPKDKNGKNKKL